MMVVVGAPRAWWTLVIAVSNSSNNGNSSNTSNNSDSSNKSNNSDSCNNSNSSSSSNIYIYIYTIVCIL